MTPVQRIEEARVLTARQPWAHAIIHFGKDVENRSINLAGSYRGPIAIHAAMAWDNDWRERNGARPLIRALFDADFPDVDFGAIIGVVDLVDVHRTTGNPISHCYQVGVPNGLRDAIDSGQGLCSPWAESHSEMWHLILANPRPLSEPIPYTGALGLRRLPVDVVAAINADLGTVQA